MHAEVSGVAIATTTDSLLHALRLACVDVARELDPTRTPPLRGWCVAVALMVRAVGGGTLVAGIVVNDAGESEPHYWNRLADGREVDLTSDQYGGDGTTPVAAGQTVSNMPELLPLDALLFAERVVARL